MPSWCRQEQFYLDFLWYVQQTNKNVQSEIQVELFLLDPTYDEDKVTIVKL
jgi:alpha-galactosidase